MCVLKKKILLKKKKKKSNFSKKKNKKMGNLHIFSNSNINYEKKLTVIPFNNNKIQKIAEKFHLSSLEMMKFHSIFRSMDKQGSGYIIVENMFDFVEEEQTSILSPYIIKLF